jgi:hypothetical protein
MRSMIITLLTIIMFTRCIDAPRENIYDPENPDRAYLSAAVYESGAYPMGGATISLIQNGTVVRTDTSGTAGTIEFEDIIPGIYEINAHAFHYSTVTYPPESLWAAVHIESLRIELNTLDFEDENQGSAQPYRFSPVIGSWAITEDLQQPLAHSTPNVYRGSSSTANGLAISLCQNEAEDFLFEANIKVDTSSGNRWRAGVVLRYQNLDNFYMITITSDTAYCDVIINGQRNNIHTKIYESTPGVWQRLRIERPHEWIFLKVNLNDTLLFSIYDNVFSAGRVGFVVQNEELSSMTTAYFDDPTLDLTYGISEYLGSNLHTSH